MKGTVELNGMAFRAFHGCLESERIEGNDFLVDFSADCDISAAAASDDLDYAVNYAAIYELIAARMAIPSNLLETLAADMAGAIAQAFPQLENIRVRVVKKNPPVDGPVESSAVSVCL